MISTSGVDWVLPDDGETVFASERKMRLAARLFASITHADKKVLDVEKFTSQSFLERFEAREPERLKNLYENTSAIPYCDELKDVMSELVFGLTDKNKIALLRSICAVASCDGEIHPNEQSIIKGYMEATEIDQFARGQYNV